MSKNPKALDKPKAFETLPIWRQTKALILALKSEVGEGADYPPTTSALLEKCVAAYREVHGLAPTSIEASTP